MPKAGADTATVKAVVVGDQTHASFDNVTFLDRKTVLTHRGPRRHPAPAGQRARLALVLRHHEAAGQDQRRRQAADRPGRDPEATGDIAIKEPAPPTPLTHNDGDNELTGVHVSDGSTSAGGILGAEVPPMPAATSPWRIFVTGQHGPNITYEIVGPAATPRDDGARRDGPRGTCAARRLLAPLCSPHSAHLAGCGGGEATPVPRRRAAPPRPLAATSPPPTSSASWATAFARSSTGSRSCRSRSDDATDLGQDLPTGAAARGALHPGRRRPQRPRVAWRCGVRWRRSTAPCMTRYAVRLPPAGCFAAGAVPRLRAQLRRDDRDLLRAPARTRSRSVRQGC